MRIPTYEELLNRSLSRVPSDTYKGEGSLIYDTVSPVCFELAQVYMELKAVLERTYADTSFDEDLARRCREQGIVRKSATKAIRKGTFNLEISLETKFALNDTTYTVIEKIKNFEYKLECEQAGVIGNLYTGTLIPLENIDGLEEAKLSDILIPGEDIEEDEALRERYYSSLENKSFGGNIEDYKQKVKAINGIGGVKVISVWNGGGTVKLVIMDSAFSKPSQELIESSQALIDPIPNQGKGEGIAPIGHVVTVEGAEETVINVESNISLQNGYTWEDVNPSIVNTVQEYLKSLCSTWDKTENIVIRIAYIETRILQVTGVLDIQQTKLNGAFTNLILGAYSIPKLGSVINT